MIRIVTVDSSSISDPMLLGDNDTDIERAAKGFSIPKFLRNGHWMCLIRNGKEELLKAAGIIEASPAEEADLKIRYGVFA